MFTKMFEYLFFFVMIPLGTLVNLALSPAMPTMATKVTYFEFALAGAVCVSLALANVIAKGKLEGRKIMKLMSPTAAFGLVMAVNCGILYLVGA